MTLAHVNIGSNLGNRAELIDRAVDLLERRVGHVQGRSRAVESASWGYDSPNRFLNVGVNVETNLCAGSVVSELLKIEKEIEPDGNHRTAVGEYADRMIDLDLICLGSEVSENPGATLPHPRMEEREFVLIPLAEILPEWIHPRNGLTADEMLSRLSNKINAVNVDHLSHNH